MNVEKVQMHYAPYSIMFAQQKSNIVIIFGIMDLLLSEYKALPVYYLVVQWCWTIENATLENVMYCNNINAAFGK